MKKMNFKTLSICTGCLVLVLAGIVGIGTKAGSLSFVSTGDVVTQDGETLFAVEDLTTLDNKIEAVSSDLTALETSVGNNKTEILNALSVNPNLNVEPDASFADITTYIQNMSTIPADTYFYEDGTEGDSATIVRYKKIEGEYYVCDANGTVSEGTAATDVTSKTLVEYTPTAAGNLSAGSAGYASNSFLLGDGSDNAAYYDKGYVEGQEKYTIKTYSKSGNNRTFTFDVALSGYTPIIASLTSANIYSETPNTAITGSFNLSLSGSTVTVSLSGFNNPSFYNGCSITVVYKKNNS